MATVLRILPTDPHGEIPTIAPGGASSFDRIYTDHFSFVWRCLRGLGLRDAALDDAAQDVFLVVHRQLSMYRNQSTVRTWLYGILRNVASNHHRAVRRKGWHRAPPQPDSPIAIPDPALDPLERAQNAEAAAFVQDFISGLDQKKRDVFLLAVLEEMSVPEVATTLAISVDTAYTRLRRARAEFQRALLRHQGKS